MTNTFTAEAFQRSSVVIRQPRKRIPIPLYRDVVSSPSNWKYHDYCNDPGRAKSQRDACAPGKSNLLFLSARNTPYLLAFRSSWHMPRRNPFIKATQKMPKLKNNRNFRCPQSSCRKPFSATTKLKLQIFYASFVLPKYSANFG